MTNEQFYKIARDARNSQINFSEDPNFDSAFVYINNIADVGYIFFSPERKIVHKALDTMKQYLTENDHDKRLEELVKNLVGRIDVTYPRLLEKDYTINFFDSLSN